MFEVGDKVVCIDASNWEIVHHKDVIVTPKENICYTIRNFEKDGIRLEEIINDPIPIVGYSMPIEIAFKARRFVKLSDFEEMEEALNEVHQILEMELA